MNELRKRDDAGAPWIAFALLSMSDHSLGAIAQMVREIRAAKLTPGMFRRVTHQEGDTVISLIASLDLPPSMLRERTIFRTGLEKYRRKALRSIGIGIMVGDQSQPFYSAIWMEGPWEYDEAMEKLLITNLVSFRLMEKNCLVETHLASVEVGRNLRSVVYPKLMLHEEKGSNDDFDRHIYQLKTIQPSPQSPRDFKNIKNKIQDQIKKIYDIAKIILS